MKVVSVNIGKKTAIVHQGKREETGIYKKPVNSSIFLGREDVVNDQVVDRRYHGGSDKACYAYGLQAYNYWGKIFPKVEMSMGMFGENLTIDGLDETSIFIGQVFKVGEATIQVSQPRIPCYKLGIRFGDKRIVKQFQQSNLSGVYFRILQEGKVSVADKLIEQKTIHHEPITVAEVFDLFKGGKFNQEWATKALTAPFLSESIKIDIRKKSNHI